MLLVIIALMSCSCGEQIINATEGEKDMVSEFKITDTQKKITKNIFETGCIKDETAAIEVASAILKSVYGEEFDNEMPLVVHFNEKEATWLVKTQLPDGFEGGSKYIIIKKSNAEVVAIWATK